MNNYNEESLILSVPESSEISIGNVARIIAGYFDYTDHITFDTSFSDGQYAKTADNTMLMKHINKFEFTGIDQGIQNTIAWFKANFENIRK